MDILRLGYFTRVRRYALHKALFFGLEQCTPLCLQCTEHIFWYRTGLFGIRCRLLGLSPDLGQRVQFAEGTNLRCREDPDPETIERFASLSKSSSSLKCWSLLFLKNVSHFQNFCATIRRFQEKKKRETFSKISEKFDLQLQIFDSKKSVVLSFY